MKITQGFISVFACVLFIGALNHFTSQAQCTPAPTTGNDNITCTGIVYSNVDGDSGNDIITNSGTLHFTIDGGAGNDTLINSGTVGILLTGGADNDTLINSGRVNNTIFGDTGNDIIINSGTATLSIFGGADNDSITNTNTGTVGGFIQGEEGNDFISNYGSVTSNLIGNDGKDTLSNSGTVNNLIGGDDNDTLSNSGTMNTILGGDDNDTISNSGSVTGYISGGTGNDTITLIDGTVAGIIYADDGYTSTGSVIDNDVLVFAQVVAVCSDFDALSAEISSADPVNGTITINTNVFTWNGFESLRNALRLPDSCNIQSTSVFRVDGRMNWFDVGQAPFAAYCSPERGLEIISIDPTNNGIVTREQMLSAVAGDVLLSAGNTQLVALGEGQFQVSAPIPNQPSQPYVYTFNFETECPAQ
jgi:hypothetical protein